MKPRILFSLIAALALFIAALFSIPPDSQARSKTKDPDLKKRQEMVVISRQLGVTCTYCHDVKNFRKGNMQTYKTALDHMRITRMLNKEGFHGKVKVDCYFCHRGTAKFDYKEKL